MGKNKTPIDKEMTREKAIKQGGYYNTDGDWNNIITRDDYPNKILRGRVECLVFNGTKMYMALHEDGKYRVPGGGFDIGVSNKDQCYMETKEEAKIKIKNIRYTGVTYVKIFENRFDDDKNSIPYDGSVNEVYIADYDGDYEGYIRKELRDSDLTYKGKFYELDEIKDILQPAHRQAIENMFQLNTPLQESAKEEICINICVKLKDALKSLHNKSMCTCIHCRDIESDDGGYIYAEYNIEDSIDIDALKRFIIYATELAQESNCRVNEPESYSYGHGFLYVYN